ncbi:hypothetical protein PAXINDRAFT_18312 [Paxillus involutus ATCC 200175]|uniref:Unplaced genomic scaffold PAXINscaffold_275, whole genome shotgun sequence n=1 Tax=Paxillus involutus ATCC 200175 TaxID=664439 RepID=A0A0C9TBZ2_PAXIN|nr:hypothetical protein PAXINDRAFT_18312 [Paxillus involutus ATCC 200175]
MDLTHSLSIILRLAEQTPWKNDIKDIIKLILCLSIITSKKYVIPHRDLGNWTARLVQLTATQTNSFDCGLSVLAQIAVVLQGYDTTGLQEKDMALSRSYL